MTVFVIAAVLLVLIALAAALQPLWRHNRVAGAGLFASAALVAGLLYLLVGTPKALDSAQRRAPDTLSDAVAQLVTELERNPNQPEGWRLLARAHASQGRFAEARDALARAAKLAPDEPDVLAEAAEARALATQDRRFDEPAIAMLRHALEVQPMHQRARWFLGIAQRQAQQPADAAKTWEPLLAVVEPGTADSLREQINAARAEAGLPPLPAPPPAAPARALLRVIVDIAPQLKQQLDADDVLFVLARQPGGPSMPVAAKRIPAKDFPIALDLSDADGPMPTLKLSQLPQVELLARVSRQGTANRMPGDFESAPQVAKVSATEPYRLLIGSLAE